MIQRLDKCDFMLMWEWRLAQKEMKKQVMAERRRRGEWERGVRGVYGSLMYAGD